MQYNESQYNGDSYNLTEYALTLDETITSIDADVVKDVDTLRIDSQATADVIGGSASLQAFLETVTIFQRAKTPFVYNNGMYNQYMYNARLDEDEILLMPTKFLEDSVFSMDTLGDFQIAQLLTEILASTDAIFFSGTLDFADFIFLSEFFSIQVTNKALNDTIRTADWLTIERHPANEEWFD